MENRWTHDDKWFIVIGFKITILIFLNINSFKSITFLILLSFEDKLFFVFYSSNLD